MISTILWFGGQRNAGLTDAAANTSGGAFTVTVCVAVAELFCASVAVHVMVVVPRGYGSLRFCPSLRTPATDTLLQLSDVVGDPTETFAVHDGPAVTVMFAGAEIVGGVESTTVTVWVALALLPCPSLAV